MGKNVTKKKQPQKQRNANRYLRAGVLTLLVAVGAGTLAGLALVNANSKPNRDMKWYVRNGSVQVAAPPVGEGYSQTDVASVPSTARRGADILAGRTGSDQGGAEVADLSTEEPTEEPTEDPTQAPTETPTETPTGLPTLEPAVTLSGAVTIKITAVGDCTFGGEIGSKGRRRFIDLASANGYDYFFQNVRTLFQTDDLTIVNLEGPLTSVTKASKHGSFVFKGDPEYVNILSGSSVELCNLANNHALDYGTAGMKETAKVLEEKGIGYCGKSAVYSANIKGVRVTALGFDQWSNDKSDITSAVKKARKDCDLLIVNMHWGTEGHRDQEARQVTMGHAAIDAGADLVIGTHPHVYQGIEKYKDKYIVYSLGNFCFAGNSNPGDKRCLIFQQTFSFNPGMGIARANIMDAGINIIPCTISSTKETNDFQPTIMTAEEGGELLKAVASRSTNFTLTDTKWMLGNYMANNGLLQSNAPQAADLPEEAPIPEEAEPTPAAQEPVSEA